MGAAKLPAQLELLLTDEPVLDVYSRGPWRVPDGLFDDIADRAARLGKDPRVELVAREMTTFFDPATTTVGSELWMILVFLFGASSVRAGNRGDVEYEVFGNYRRTPEPPTRDSTTWFTQEAAYRPPGDWLIERDCSDRERRTAGFELARECLDVFEGVEPLEPRRQALIALHDRWKADPELVARHLTSSRPTLETVWADLADDEILGALPELAGPVGYLDWATSGFVAAHERLAAQLPGSDDTDLALARLLKQGGVTIVPAQFAVAVGTDRYGVLQEHVDRLKSTHNDDTWVTEIRSWLARGIVADEVPACRAWLDMAVRITGTVEGLPGNPVRTKARIPIPGFQQDLRQLCRTRKVVNPLVAEFAGTTDEKPKPNRRPVAELPDGDKIVGQPDLLAVVEGVLADADHAVRLLVAGPEGTGKGTTASVVESALIERGLITESVWVSDQLFANLHVSESVIRLQAAVAECKQGKLLVVDGLDKILSYDACGHAVAEELRRLVKRNAGLHVVALCRPGGEARIFDVNPALCSCSA